MCRSEAASVGRIWNFDFRRIPFEQKEDHYHLHVVYVPVVEKQILWSKRCKDKALVGTVKETVMQVSRSKKWASKPLLDDAGKPVLQKSGKPVLKKSYSVLQDDFFNYMRNAGYTDVERGERGSTEEHLTVTQFKVQREQERLDTLTAPEIYPPPLLATLPIYPSPCWTMLESPSCKRTASQS